MPVTVHRLPIKLEPDPGRVITRLFCPGDSKRTREIIERALTFPSEEIDKNAWPHSSIASARAIPICVRFSRSISSKSKPPFRLIPI